MANTVNYNGQSYPALPGGQGKGKGFGNLWDILQNGFEQPPAKETTPPTPPTYQGKVGVWRPGEQPGEQPSVPAWRQPWLAPELVAEHVPAKETTPPEAPHLYLPMMTRQGPDAGAPQPTPPGRTYLPLITRGGTEQAPAPKLVPQAELAAPPGVPFAAAPAPGQYVTWGRNLISDLWPKREQIAQFIGAHPEEFKQEYAKQFGQGISPYINFINRNTDNPVAHAVVNGPTFAEATDPKADRPPTIGGDLATAKSMGVLGAPMYMMQRAYEATTEKIPVALRAGALAAENDPEMKRLKAEAAGLDTRMSAWRKAHEGESLGVALSMKDGDEYRVLKARRDEIQRSMGLLKLKYAVGDNVQLFGQEVGRARPGGGSFFNPTAAEQKEYRQNAPFAEQLVLGILTDPMNLVPFHLIGDAVMMASKYQRMRPALVAGAEAGKVAEEGVKLAEAAQAGTEVAKAAEAGGNVVKAAEAGADVTQAAADASKVAKTAEADVKAAATTAKAAEPAGKAAEATGGTIKRVGVRTWEDAEKLIGEGKAHLMTEAEATQSIKRYGGLLQRAADKWGDLPVIGWPMRATAEMKASLMIDHSTDFVKTAFQQFSKQPEEFVRVFSAWVKNPYDAEVMKALGPEVAGSLASVEASTFIRRAFVKDVSEAVRATSEGRLQTALEALGQAKEEVASLTGEVERVAKADTAAARRQQKLAAEVANAQDDLAKWQDAVKLREQKVAELQAKEGARATDLASRQNSLKEAQRQASRAERRLKDAQHLAEIAPLETAQKEREALARATQRLKRAQDEADRLQKIADINKPGAIDTETIARVIAKAGDDPLLALELLTEHFDQASKSFFGVAKEITGADGTVRTVFEMPEKSWARKMRDGLTNAVNVLYMGYNPGYALRNASNNMLTAIADGVNPFTPAGVMNEFFVRWGPLPAAGDKGLGAGGEYGRGVLGARNKLRASQEPISAWRPFNVAWENRKDRPFAAMSSEFERLASQRLTYTHLERSWSKMWPNTVDGLRDALLKAPGNPLTREQSLYVIRRLYGALNPEDAYDILKDMTKGVRDLASVPDEAATRVAMEAAGHAGAEAVAAVAAMPPEVRPIVAETHIAAADAITAARDEIVALREDVKPLMEADAVVTDGDLASFLQRNVDITVAARERDRALVERVIEEADKIDDPDLKAALWDACRDARRKARVEIADELDNLADEIMPELGFSDKAIADAKAWRKTTQETWDKSDTLWTNFWQDRRAGVRGATASELYHEVTTQVDTLWKDWEQARIAYISAEGEQIRLASAKLASKRAAANAAHAGAEGAEEAGHAAAAAAPARTVEEEMADIRTKAEAAAAGKTGPQQPGPAEKAWSVFEKKPYTDPGVAWEGERFAEDAPATVREFRNTDLWERVAKYEGTTASALLKQGPERRLRIVNAAFELAGLDPIENLNSLKKITEAQYNAIIEYAGRDKVANAKLLREARQTKAATARAAELAGHADALEAEIERVKALTGKDRPAEALIKRAENLAEKARAGSANVDTDKIDTIAKELVKYRQAEAAAPAAEQTVEEFAQRLARGEKMTSPEDLQFQANNGPAIEAELQRIHGAGAGAGAAENAALREAGDEAYKLQQELADVQEKLRALREARFDESIPADQLRQMQAEYAPLLQREQELKTAIAEAEAKASAAVPTTASPAGAVPAGTELLDELKPQPAPVQVPQTAMQRRVQQSVARAKKVAEDWKARTYTPTDRGVAAGGATGKAKGGTFDVINQRRADKNVARMEELVQRAEQRGLTSAEMDEIDKLYEPIRREVQKGIAAKFLGVTPEIGKLQANGLALLVEGNADYLGMTADDWMDKFIDSIGFSDTPGEGGLMKTAKGDGNANIKALRKHLEEGGLAASDVDDYVARCTEWIRKYVAGQGETKVGKGVLRGNAKTLLGVDISSSCPYRKAGRSCLYCYVEPSRTAKGSQAAKLYEHAEYRHEILSMPPEFIEFLNSEMGGLRVFSMGDFQYSDIKTLDDIVADSEKVGLKLKVITKQEEMVRTYAKYDHVSFNLSTEFLPEYFETSFPEAIMDNLISNGKAKASGRKYDYSQIRAILRMEGIETADTMSTEQLDNIIKRSINALRSIIGPIPEDGNALRYTPEMIARVRAERSEEAAALMEAALKKAQEDALKPLDFTRTMEPSPLRKKVAFGWTMQEVEKLRAELPDAAHRIQIRYVAMTPQDVINAAADPRISVLTLYHGDNAPAKIYQYMRRQNPHMSGIRQMYPFVMDRVESILRKNGVLKAGEVLAEVDGSRQIGDAAYKGLVEFLDDIMPQNVQEELERYLQQEVWPVIKDTKLSDFANNPEKATTWDRLRHDYPGDEPPPVRRLEELASIGSASTWKKPGYDAHTVMSRLEEIRSKNYGVRIALPVDVERLAKPGEEVVVNGVRRAVKEGERVVVKEGGFSGKSTIEDLLKQLEIYEQGDPMVAPARYALAGIFQGGKAETWLTRRKIGQFLPREMVEKTLRRTMSDGEYSAFLQTVIDKSCCLTGKCGSCALGCALKGRKLIKEQETAFKALIDGTPVAQVLFEADGRAVVRALTESTNVSDMAHELGHVFRRTLKDEERRAIERDLGVFDGVWSRDAEEYFADSFEKYLASGHAPTPRLKGVFESFKRWIKAIYRSVAGTPLENEISPAMKAVYDRMLGGDTALPTEIPTRNMGPRPGPQAVRAAEAGAPEAYGKEMPPKPGVTGQATRRAERAKADRPYSQLLNDLAGIAPEATRTYAGLSPAKQNRVISRVIEAYDGGLIDRNELESWISEVYGSNRMHADDTDALLAYFRGQKTTPGSDVVTPMSEADLQAELDAIGPKRVKPVEAAAAPANEVAAAAETVPTGEAPGGEVLTLSLEDLTPEEYQEALNAAVDWSYLTVANGGMARKSQLDKWLMERYNLDQASAHTISNHVWDKRYYTASSTEGTRWQEIIAGRPAPRLSDYPDLEEAFGKRPFQVNEKLLLNSPHLAGSDLENAVVSFRGGDGRNATVWTGQGQITVPMDRLSRLPADAGEVRLGPYKPADNNVFFKTRRAGEPLSTLDAKVSIWQRMKDAWASLAQRGATEPTVVPQLTAEQAAWLKEWTRSQVLPKMTRDKYVAGQIATEMRNYALGDYSHRRNLHELLTWIYPYSFWYAFSYPAWALRLAQHPNYLAWYAHYKRLMRDMNTRIYREQVGDPNAELPEYYANSLFVTLPFVGTQHEVNVEDSLNPLKNLTNPDFEPKDLMEAGPITALQPGGSLESIGNATGLRTAGAIYNKLGSFGPSLQSPFGWILAVALANGWGGWEPDPDAAGQLWAYTFPQERAIKGATALAREKIPALHDVIPAGGTTPTMWLTGWNSQGSYWDRRQIPRYLVDLYNNKQLTQEQMDEAGYTWQGEKWDQAKQNQAIAKFGPSVGSLVLGQGYKPRDVTDIQIQKMWEDRNALMATKEKVEADVYSQGWEALRKKWPWMDVYMMARESNPDKRLMSFYWIVKDRLPPGAQGTQILTDAGLSWDMLNELKANKYDLSKWDKNTRDRFRVGIEKIAGVTTSPDEATQKEYDQYWVEKNDIDAQAAKAAGVTVEEYKAVNKAYYDAPEGSAQRIAIQREHPWLKTAQQAAGTAREKAPTYQKFEKVPPSSGTEPKAAATSPATSTSDKVERPVTVTDTDQKIADAQALYETEAARRFGKDILDQSGQYGAAAETEAGKIAFKRDYPQIYANLLAFWKWRDEFKLAHPEWAAYKWPDQASTSSSASGATSKGTSSAKGSTSKGSSSGGSGYYGSGGYSSGGYSGYVPKYYPRSYGGGGYGGYSRGSYYGGSGSAGPSYESWSPQDYQAAVTQERTDDPSFDVFAALMFGADTVSMASQYYAMTADQRAAWIAANPQLWAKLVKYLAWLQAQGGSKQDYTAMVKQQQAQQTPTPPPPASSIPKNAPYVPSETPTPPG